MTVPGAQQGATMETFLDQVKRAAELPGQEEADRLARATLSALGDAVSEGEAAKLAPALPPELRSTLSSRSSQAHGFDKTTFLDAVSGGTDATDFEEVERQARAVLRTMRSWEQEDHVDKALDQLPAGIADLFTF